VWGCLGWGSLCRVVSGVAVLALSRIGVSWFLLAVFAARLQFVGMVWKEGVNGWMNG